MTFKTTLKTGTEYDAAFLTIEADTAEQFAAEIVNAQRVFGDVVAAADLFKQTATLGGAGIVGQTAPAAPVVTPQAPPVQQQAAPQPWGQAQQQAPQQQGGAQLDPLGRTCELCGEVLQAAQTRTGKNQWKCRNYRYNNGNPNGHRLEWA